MFNEQISLSRMKNGLRRMTTLRSANFRTISRWVPRKPILGMELNGDVLTLACIKLGVGRTPLTFFGSIPEFASLSPQDLGRKLREFLKPLHGEEPAVALGLPRREVIVRFLSLPAAAKKSLVEAVALQVEMYKPTDGEPFDWDTSLVEEQKCLAATLLFAPHSVVEKYASLFGQAGFPLMGIAPTQFFLLHMFLRCRQVSQKQHTVMLACRDMEVELALLEGKRLVYSRGFSLTKESATLPSDIVAQIHQAFSSLRWREGDGQAIVVSGDLPDSVQLALASFGSVEQLEDNIKVPGMSEQLLLQRYAGAAAIALSRLSRNRRLYSLNLLPAGMRPVRSHIRHLPTYILLAANVALLLAVSVRVPLQNYMLLRQYRNEISAVQVRADEMKRVLQNARAMRQQLLDFDVFQRRGRQPLEALNEIAQKLPQDAWLNVFSFKRGQVDLSGSAKAAAPLLPMFQSSLQFQDVKFNGALNQDSSGTERFHLQMRLKEKP